MPPSETKSASHPDQVISDLIAACSGLAPRLDLSEGVHYVLGEVALMVRDGTLTTDEEACVFKFLNRMALGDRDTQNLLVVGVLEILGDYPQSVDRSRAKLEGRALLLFERVLRGWKLSGGST